MECKLGFVRVRKKNGVQLGLCGSELKVCQERGACLAREVEEKPRERARPRHHVRAILTASARLSTEPVTVADECH
jgi:hypothetical protein